MSLKGDDPLVELVGTFNKHGVEYVIVGAHAVGWHGALTHGGTTYTLIYRLGGFQ